MGVGRNMIECDPGIEVAEKQLRRLPCLAAVGIGLRICGWTWRLCDLLHSSRLVRLISLPLPLQISCFFLSVNLPSRDTFFSQWLPHPVSHSSSAVLPGPWGQSGNPSYRSPHHERSHQNTPRALCRPLRMSYWSYGNVCRNSPVSFPSRGVLCSAI